MCGIVGYIGPKDVVPVLIDGLRRLEYRGYDSAGVAVVQDGEIELRRSAGKLSRLEDVITLNPLIGRIRRRPHALGHPRPADRGERASASRLHAAGSSSSTTGSSRTTSISSSSCRRQGHTFVTETDTEIVAHLVEREIEGRRPRERRAAGAAATCAASSRWCSSPPTIPTRSSPSATVRRSSSDSGAASSSSRPISRRFSATPRDVVFLGDEEMAVITAAGVAFTDFFGPRRSPKTTHARAVGSDHGGEGRLQALHAEGDLRAADGRPARRFSAARRQDSGRVFLAGDRRSRTRCCATSSESRSWRAARRGTRRSSASS